MVDDGIVTTAFAVQKIEDIYNDMIDVALMYGKVTYKSKCWRELRLHIDLAGCRHSAISHQS